MDINERKNYAIETRCVQGGYTPGNGEPRQIPIIQSTTFKYATSEDMGKLFDLEASGYFYSRLQNPTCDTVASRIAILEGGTAAMLTSSGQAANFYAVFNIANCGDHVVASSAIYGGTYNLFSVTMKKMGILRALFYGIVLSCAYWGIPGGIAMLIMREHISDMGKFAVVWGMMAGSITAGILLMTCLTDSVKSRQRKIEQ